MRFTLNNLNVVSTGTLPVELSQVRSFKYKDGAFFYINNGDAMKMQNGNLEMLNQPDDHNYAMVPISNSSYILSGNQGSNYYLTNGYSNTDNNAIYDLDYDNSSSTLWIYSEAGEVRIKKSTAGGITTIYDSNGMYPTSSGYTNYNLKYFEGKVYFNSKNTLYSVNDDGTNLTVLNSSNDLQQINGIVITF